MPCPYCGYPFSEVKDKRSAGIKGWPIRRRRRCLGCKRRWSTYERIAWQTVQAERRR